MIQMEEQVAILLYLIIKTNDFNYNKYDYHTFHSIPDNSLQIEKRKITDHNTFL